MKRTGFLQRVFLLACLSLFYPRIRGFVVDCYQCTIEAITPRAQHPSRGAPSFFEMLPTKHMRPDLFDAATGTAEPYGRELNTFLRNRNGSIDLLGARVGAENIYVIDGEGAPITDVEYDVALLRKDWRHGEVVSERHTTLGDDLIPSESTSLLRSGVLTFCLPLGRLRSPARCCTRVVGGSSIRRDRVSSAAFQPYESLAPDCGGAFLVSFWWQNLPGLDSRAVDDDGDPMLNWLPFLFY